VGSDLYLSKKTFEDATPTPLLPVFVALTPIAEQTFQNQPIPALNSAPESFT
jgi:hypothetical protein